MSKRGAASRKIRPTASRVAAMGMALAAVLGVSVFAGGQAYANSGWNCKNQPDGAVCIAVDSVGNEIGTVNGEANLNDGASLQGSTGHVQVTNPTGRTLCNSTEQPLTDAGETMSCSWNGAWVAHATGQYCTTLWIYTTFDGFQQDGQECEEVLAS